ALDAVGRLVRDRAVAARVEVVVIARERVEARGLLEILFDGFALFVEPTELVARFAVVEVAAAREVLERFSEIVRDARAAVRVLVEEREVAARERVFVSARVVVEIARDL